MIKYFTGDGRRTHDILRASFSREKKIITPSNIFAKACKFVTRCLLPVIPPIEYTILYMFQSMDYIPSSSFISKHSRIEHFDAKSMWKIVWYLSQITIEDITDLFFTSVPSKVLILVNLFMLFHLYIII